ncbi:hypothetical protein M2282_002344 [Variovorax boronicumulans]|uniref:hypothetical protein n=1 Tax=Variovorax boronicumulans TaxID=436515 RepID=UPI002475064E|nr:hypothetical protein [Variovorax boronicumulans]MDH6167195.1 hypothetical protein [Variovorax boronicumulans]
MHEIETIWDDAETRALPLARALARMELAFGNWDLTNTPGDALEAAIHSAWFSVVASAREAEVSLDPPFIASLHALIASPIGAPGEGIFREGVSPLDWATFKSALDDTALEYGLAGNTEAWVLAQLYWGTHLDSLMLSVAWLLSGGIRLQAGMRMLVPDARHDAALKQRLAWAGPGSHDAESLRGLFGSYQSEQELDSSTP